MLGTDRKLAGGARWKKEHGHKFLNLLKRRVTKNQSDKKGGSPNNKPRQKLLCFASQCFGNRRFFASTASYNTKYILIRFFFYQINIFTLTQEAF